LNDVTWRTPCSEDYASTGPPTKWRYDGVMIQESPRALFGVFLTVALIYGLIFMERTAPGLVTPELLHLYRVSPAVLSLMTLAQYFVYATLQVPVTWVGQRWPAEALLVAGAVLDGVGTVLFGLSHTFFTVVLSRGVVGLGDALIWLNIVQVLARRFSPGIFGRIIGLVAMTGNIGAIFGTFPLAVWIQGSGWRTPFLAMGGFLIAMAAVSWGVFFRWAPAPGATARVRRGLPWQALWQKRRRLWGPVLGHWGMMGPFLGFVSLLAVPYLETVHHVGRVTASLYMAAGLLGSLLGGPLGGFLADRFGVVWPYRFVAVENAVAWMIWAWGSAWFPHWALLTLFGLTGLANGASVLTFAVTRHFFPLEEQGLAAGLANTAGFLAAVLVPLGMGLWISRGGSYASMIGVAGLASLLGVVGSFLLPVEPQTRPAS